MSGNPNINNAFSNYVKHNWTWIEITKSPAIEIFTTTNAMEKVSKCDSTVLVCDGDKYMHMDYRYMVNGFKFLLPNEWRTEWRRERLFGQVANTNAWLIGPWRPICVWARYGHESHNIVSMLVFYLYICCFSPAQPNPISIQFIHVYDANTRCSESLHFSLNFSLHLRTSWHFVCLEFARKSKNKWIIQFIDKKQKFESFRLMTKPIANDTCIFIK